MRACLTFLALCALLFLIQAPACAILIKTGPKQHVGGFWEGEDDKQVTVRFKTSDGKEKVQEFAKSKITILHQVDRARLGKLSKDKPKAYRDYADELAKNPTDPEALELALRLYLITAHLDPANLGRSSLLNMSALATHPADARKYRAMAFLLDSKYDPTLLKVEATKVTPAALKALTEFQKAMKFYRTGDLDKAKAYADREGVAEYFGKAGTKDKKSFLQACKDANCGKCKAGKMDCATCNGKKVTDPFGAGPQPCTACNGKGTQKCTSCDGFGQNPIPEDYLKAVLRAEIWALEQILPSDPAVKKNASGGWSNAVSNPQASIPLLTLENITEFDPRKCVFRNGTWEVP